VSGYDAVRNRLKAANPSGDFEKFWRKTLTMASWRTQPTAAQRHRQVRRRQLVADPRTQSRRARVSLPSRSDYSRRAFCQQRLAAELPKPITKLVWDNAALVGPNTSWNLGVTHTSRRAAESNGQNRIHRHRHRALQQQVTAAGWMCPDKQKVSWSCRSAMAEKSRLYPERIRFQRLCGAHF